MSEDDKGIAYPIVALIGGQPAGELRCLTRHSGELLSRPLRMLRFRADVAGDESGRIAALCIRTFHRPQISASWLLAAIMRPMEMIFASRRG